MSLENSIVVHVLGRRVLNDLSLVLAAHVNLHVNTVTELLHFGHTHGFRSDGHRLLVEVERLSDLNCW